MPDNTKITSIIIKSGNVYPVIIGGIFGNRSIKIPLDRYNIILNNQITGDESITNSYTNLINEVVSLAPQGYTGDLVNYSSIMVNINFNTIEWQSLSKIKWNKSENSGRWDISPIFISYKLKITDLNSYSIFENDTLEISKIL